ncbi:MAG: DUF4238 domain-containing protein [Gammaproteobacteria bacterium]|nr:DUF4238 domain-containing protein [Gammaproteobacteria bacterium]
MDTNRQASGPKRQHFVPCCYLKFFAHSGDWADGRKTRVYFTNGEISRCVPVEDVGADDFTYSKEFPEFDNEFHNMERDYPPIVEKILASESLTKKEYFGLVITMIDFNLRNIAYENRSDRERKDVYGAISRSCMEDLFWEAPGRGTSFQENLDWLAENWRIQALETESGEKFITSDNPSTIYCHERFGRPILIYLPIHPDKAVIAFDRRYIRAVSRKVSDDALSILNGLQVNRCVRHVFSEHDTLAADQQNVNSLKELLQREKPSRFATQEGLWQRDYINIASPAVARFQFIRQRKRVISELREAIRLAISSRYR